MPEDSDIFITASSSTIPVTEIQFLSSDAPSVFSMSDVSLPYLENTVNRSESGTDFTTLTSVSLNDTNCSFQSKPDRDVLSTFDSIFEGMDYGPQVETQNSEVVEDTELCSNRGIESEIHQSVEGTSNEPEDDIYEYYYMMKDCHEDMLKQLEEELAKEENEVDSKTKAQDELLKELEDAVEESKMKKRLAAERKKEKQRIRHLKSSLAIANKERSLFCCFVCSKAFYDEEEVRKHISEVHLANKAVYALKCRFCYMRFKLKAHLSRHEGTHTRTQYFRCSACNLDYREEISLKIHMSKQHSLTSDGDLISKIYECRCGEKFGLQVELKRHEWYCHNREKITERRRKIREDLEALSVRSEGSCSVSPALSNCSSMSSVSTGQLGRSGRPVKDKSCPYCFLVCASMQARLRHIQRKHADMVNDSATTNHCYIKVESPKLPFGCQACGKSFASHSSLSTHRKRIHENKREHECDICGKGYPLPSELRKHIKRVHENHTLPPVTSISEFEF